jgi:hypothetical protein
VIVRLSSGDLYLAIRAGHERHRHHCERTGRRVTAAGLFQEAVGAVAEDAVARLFRGSWNSEVGKAHYGSHDVVTRCGAFEVKATHHAHGHMLVYTDTADDARVVFATVEKIPAGREDTLGQYVNVVGWLRAGDAKRAAWWRPKFLVPCYAVPQSALRPLSELLELPCWSSPSSSDSPPSSGATTTEPASTPR